MKDELQGKMVEILSSIQTATGKASDFALTQLPDVAQSYVAFGRVSSLIYLSAWVLASVVTVLLLTYMWRNPRYSEYSWDEGKNVRSDNNQFALVFWSTLFFATVINIFFALNSAALVWFAPKVWLLKELAGLIK